MPNTVILNSLDTSSSTKIKKNILILCILLIFIQCTFGEASTLSELAKTLPINFLRSYGFVLFFLSYFVTIGKYYATTLLYIVILYLIPVYYLTYIKEDASKKVEWANGALTEDRSFYPEFKKGEGDKYIWFELSEKAGARLNIINKTFFSLDTALIGVCALIALSSSISSFFQGLRLIFSHLF